MRSCTVRSLLVTCFLVLGRIAFAEGGDSTRVDTTGKPAIVQPPVHPIGIDRTADPRFFSIITNLPADWRDWSVQNIRPKFWPQMAAITISTAALIVYDSELWAPFYKQYKRGGTFGNVADVFSYMGDGKSQFGLAAAFAGYGLIAGDKRALRTAAQTCEAILACGAELRL